MDFFKFQIERNNMQIDLYRNEIEGFIKISNKFYEVLMCVKSIYDYITPVCKGAIFPKEFEPYLKKKPQLLSEVKYFLYLA